MITDRHVFALAYPLEPAADITPYRRITEQPDGNLLCSILAVDR